MACLLKRGLCACTTHLQAGLPPPHPEEGIDVGFTRHRPLKRKSATADLRAPVSKDGDGHDGACFETRPAVAPQHEAEVSGTVTARPCANTCGIARAGTLLS